MKDHERHQNHTTHSTRQVEPVEKDVWCNFSTRLYSVTTILLLAGFAYFAGVASPLQAETVLELQQKIGEKSSSIAELEREIAAVNKQLLSAGAEATTLEREVAIIDATRRKLQLEVSATQARIDRTELTLESLGAEIGSKEAHIEENRKALAAATRAILFEEGTSLIEALMRSQTLSEAIHSRLTLASFEASINDSLSSLRSTKAVLAEDHEEVEQEKHRLLSLRTKSADQKKIADAARTEQSKLLAAAKGEESSYRKLLADKEREKAAVEAEIRAFEAELKIVLDPDKLPQGEAAPGSLSWPLSPVRITQPFGDTEFSRANTSVYNGKGHNGMDFGGSVGTELWSARQGTVRGIGDTDDTCKGASYGKWVLIDHDNGLSTLYAHLSLIKATLGQKVAKGQLIGYLGRTGYATGPHLHFTVYATEGVRIDKLKSKVRGCGTYTLPLASLESYLNPAKYLPE